MLRQPLFWSSRASPAEKMRGLRVVYSKNFSRATIFVFWVSQLVDMFLNNLPVKQILRKSAMWFSTTFCYLKGADISWLLGRFRLPKNYPRIPKNYPKIPKKYPRIPKNYPRITKNYPRIPNNTQQYPRFKKTGFQPKLQFFVLNHSILHFVIQRSWH